MIAFEAAAAAKALSQFPICQLRHNMERGEALANDYDCEKEKYMERPYCEDLPLAIASVPMQEFQKLYPPEVALERGTMFDELYLPFEGKECRRYDE